MIQHTFLVEKVSVKVYPNLTFPIPNMPPLSFTTPTPALITAPTTTQPTTTTSQHTRQPGQPQHQHDTITTPAQSQHQRLHNHKSAAGTLWHDALDLRSRTGELAQPTVTSYTKGMQKFTDWMPASHPDSISPDTKRLRKETENHP